MKKPSDYGLYLLLGILLILFSFHAVPYTKMAKAYIGSPIQVDYGEGYLLNQARQIEEGKPPWKLYTSLEEPPFTIINYPPVMTSFSAICTRTPSLEFGRILSLFSTLMSITFLILSIQNITKKWHPGILIPLLCLSTYAFYIWSVFFRVDMFALALLCGGIYFTFNKKVPIVLPAIFLALAVYSRQTLMSFPIALFIYGLGDKNRRCQKIFLYWLTICAAAFIVLNYITDGLFFVHTATANRNIMVWSDLGRWLRHLLKFSPMYILAWLGSLIYLWIKRKESPWARLIIIYSILTALSVISIAKIGSGANYLLEWYLALFFTIGVAITRSREKLLQYFLILCLCSNMVILQKHRKNQWRILPTKEDYFSYKKAVNMVKSFRGQVISFDGSLVVKANKEVYYQPFVVTQLIKQHIIGWKNIEDMMNKEKDWMVITNFSLSDQTYRRDLFPDQLIDMLLDVKETEQTVRFRAHAPYYFYHISKDQIQRKP